MPLAHPLNNEQIAIVKQTIPILETAGPTITEHFYKRMFADKPELQHIFNMSNQRSGKQQFALFSAVAQYAKHIDNLSELAVMVERIGNKHSTYNIQPEHYPIVGHHLIETLKELAPDEFNEQVASAWTSAYGLLADIFIKKEESIYNSSANKNGGWRGAKKFRLIEKRIESELVKSLVFEPLDKQIVAEYKPGQYIGIKLSIPGQTYQEIRQYSLSNRYTEDSYQISVKREIMGTPGAVSNFLHDGLRLGDEVELYAPAGDFFYQDRQRPIALISAGVGLTPMQAIVESLAAQETRPPIRYLHACESIEQHSFKKRIDALSQAIDLTAHTWYRSDHAAQKNTYHGYMDLALIEKHLPLSDGDFYLCGPVPFMQFAKQQLVTLKVDPSRIHYEVFGPHEDF